METTTVGLVVVVVVVIVGLVVVSGIFYYYYLHHHDYQIIGLVTTPMIISFYLLQVSCPSLVKLCLPWHTCNSQQESE